MKKILNIVSYISIVMLMLSILLTVIATYRYAYIPIFRTYTIFKVILTMTLLFWSFNTYNFAENFISNKYSIGFGLLTIISFVYIILPIN